MTKDPNSCICTHCKNKNPNIAYMIQSLTDMDRNQNEQKYLDYFNQNKGKPLQPQSTQNSSTYSNTRQYPSG